LASVTKRTIAGKAPTAAASGTELTIVAVEIVVLGEFSGTL
jgi:hypothetical protein